MNALAVVLFVISVYAGGFVGTYRTVYARHYETERAKWYGSHTHAHDMAKADAVFSGALWPIMLPLMAIWRGLDRVTPVPPTRHADLLRERDEKIAELERQLGISDLQGEVTYEDWKWRR